jgi:acyl-CoA thioesterase-2
MARIAHLIPSKLRERTPTERPFDLRRSDEPEDPIAPGSAPPQRMVWFRSVAPLSDDLGLHRSLLAYVSDFAFVTTALLPHGVSWLTPGMQVASLDHVMWFHQPFRVDDWLLHVIDSPAMHGARGLVRGRIFTRDGRLIASTSQEGLLRRRTSQRVIG